ncbi:hypothetical protein GCM10027066_18160 [Dyella jejuensis]
MGKDAGTGLSTPLNASCSMASFRAGFFAQAEISNTPSRNIPSKKGRHCICGIVKGSLSKLVRLAAAA